MKISYPLYFNSKLKKISSTEPSVYGMIMLIFSNINLINKQVSELTTIQILMIASRNLKILLNYGTPSIGHDIRDDKTEMLPFDFIQEYFNSKLNYLHNFWILYYAKGHQIILR